MKRKDVSIKLTDIKINDTSIENFSSSKKEYTYYVAENEKMPTITVVKEDNNANVDVINPESIPGTCYIYVSNFAGEKIIYKVNLRCVISDTDPTTVTTLPNVKYTDAAGVEIKTLPAQQTIKAVLDLNEISNEDNITFERYRELLKIGLSDVLP